MPWKRFSIVASLIGVATLVGAADVADGWRNLKHVTRDRDYTVLLRSMECLQGQLLSASDDSLSIQMEQSRQAIIKRRQVLRIAEYRNAPSHDTVFSARSSWADVLAAEPKASEYLLVATKGGEQFRWSKPKVTDGAVAGDKKLVLKSDVRSVSYVRYTPLTRSEEYAEHEGVVLAAPRLWFGRAMLGKITVPLYDSEVAEDNSPLTCK